MSTPTPALVEMLLAIDNLFIERLEMRPSMPATLSLSSSGSWNATMAYWDTDNTKYVWFRSALCETPEAALRSLQEKVEAIPDKKTRDLQQFQQETAKLIDLGNKLGIEVQFLNPIVEMARKMASNAIAAQ